MKIKPLFINIFLVILLSLFNFLPAKAQATSEKESAMEALLKSRNFIFKAQSVQAMRGGVVQLTSAYDMMIAGDSLVTYLPYFGRSFSAPMNAADGGIKLTSTNFEYVMGEKKKKRWDITIKPIDDNNVKVLALNVSESGAATLRVTSTNRDPISFHGYVTAKE